MHTRLSVTIGVLLLASAASVRAQAPQAGQQPPPVQQVSAPNQSAVDERDGIIDLGFRGTSATGDEARLERYRDLSNGAASQIIYTRDTPLFNVNANAFNIGQLDQRYRASYIGHGLRVKGAFDSTPTNYGYITQTPWIMPSANVFTLDQSERALVQNKTVMGIPQNVADLSKVSVYRPISPAFDLASLRQAGSFSLAYDTQGSSSFDAGFMSTHRSGTQPWGASFAFNVANELPLKLDNWTHDANAGYEITGEKGMFRVAWNASFFDNNIHDLVWDNAYRLTDTNPYDASGYSNGNGPAQGRMSLPPSNSLETITGLGLFKFNKTTNLNYALTYTQMNQNDALIPWTINPVIANTNVYKTFPGLATLPRGTAEAKVDQTNALLNFTARPNRIVSFNAKYRYNDHVNKTPTFDAREYVRFDAVPEETGGETEQFNITENTFDANVIVQVAPFTSLKVGYGYDTYKRTGRSFSDMTDNAFRLSLDTVGNQWLTIRAMYEYVDRKGSGFSEDALEEGGAQGGLRFYDEADRQRNRGTLLFMVNPTDVFDVTFSAAMGKDKYNGEGHTYGLLDNDNQSYNVGVNVYPKGVVSFGANYGRDHYSANQASQNANPAGSDYGSWTDPNRLWTLSNSENVNNFNLFMDVPRAFGNKSGIKLSYDYSDSDNGFTFGGPRITELSQNVALTPGDTKPCAAGVTSCFLPLPNVTNKWQRFTAEVTYYFQKQVGVAIGYWFEKFDVSDFATVDIPGQAGTPRIDYLGEISTGYGNRPYQGNTAFVRLLYRF
jgi:MtrB/PioB family decaheme-associated outer membrane protein